MIRQKENLTFPGDGLYRCAIGLVIMSFLFFSAGKLFSQNTGQYTGFGLHQGFNFEGERLDKCKTYYDSTSHLLFNPCLDFRNRGIYSSYLARRVILGNCIACDSIAILLPKSTPDLDWDHLRKDQKEAWDYYYQLWKKQDRIEKYYIDLEGIVRGSIK